MKSNILFILLLGFSFGCYLAEPEDPEPVTVNNADLRLYYLALPRNGGPVFDIVPYTFISPLDEKIVLPGKMQDIIFEHTYNTGDNVSLIFYAVGTDSVADGKWLALFNKTKYLTGKEFRKRGFRISVDHLELKYPPGWLPD